MLLRLANDAVRDHDAGIRFRRFPMSRRRSRPPRSHRRARKLAKQRAEVSDAQVCAFMDELFGEDVHAQRLASISSGVVGVIEAGALGIHAIGRGLAATRNLVDKHAVKQINRLIGNEKVDVEAMQATWTRELLRDRQDVFVSLDWTEFDKDGHSMLVLSLDTGRGRAMPLVWKTVEKSTLKGRRNDHEDELLVRFREAVPEGVRVTVVADRGFSDQKLYAFLTEELSLDFIIRFRGVVHVTDSKGEKRPARQWVRPGGRLRALRDASVTADHCPVGMVVLVHEKGMKEPWCLASSRTDLAGAEVKRRYGKRFTCEETFRDVKDMRFGFGMKWNRVTKTARRDRLVLLAVMAIHLLTLLGAAGERVGLDRLLKTNTSKKRTLSLLRQGLRWYQLMPNMSEDRLRQLAQGFEACLQEDPIAMAFLNA